MKYNKLVVIVAIAVLGLTAACAPSSNSVAAAAPKVSAELSIESGSVDAPALYAATSELSADEVEALNMALQDEYKALATYERVIADFGEVRPFTNIARAEMQHIAALTRLFETYSVEMPANEWADKVASFDSLTEACQGGVDAEIENAALYDQLFSMVEHNDIIRVFQNLRDASEYKHLLAFERCASRAR